MGRYWILLSTNLSKLDENDAFRCRAGLLACPFLCNHPYKYDKGSTLCGPPGYTPSPAAFSLFFWSGSVSSALSPVGRWGRRAGRGGSPPWPGRSTGIGRCPGRRWQRWNNQPDLVIGHWGRRSSSPRYAGPYRSQTAPDSPTWWSNQSWVLHTWFPMIIF